MIVCAMDPGYAKLALAAIDLQPRIIDSRILEARTVETDSKAPPLERRRAIWSELEKLVTLHRPFVLAYEEQTLAGLGGATIRGGLRAQWQTSMGVARVVGILDAVAFDHGALVVEVSSKAAKIAVLGKGAGNAEKSRVKEAVLALPWARGAPNPHKISTHATDAVAIAIAGGRLYDAERWRERAHG